MVSRFTAKRSSKTNERAAFDDQTSTFIIPAGAGFEIIFCPGGRSTNILATEKQQLDELSQQGHVKRNKLSDLVLDLSAPDIEDIPLAMAASLVRADRNGYKGVHDDHEFTAPTTYDPSIGSKADGPSEKAEDPPDSALGDMSGDYNFLSESERISMWSQRHRWNGSGTLIDSDLDLRHALHLRRHSQRGCGQTPKRVGSSAAGHAHFVRQERVRSAFCLCIGMLVGAVAAWTMG